MGDGGVEGLGGLAGEVASAEVNGGEGCHDGEADAGLLEDAFDGVEGGLGVEGVEGGLDEEDVGAAVEQAAGGFGVGGDELVEGDVAVAGVVDVGGDGEGLVGGAEASGDEAGLVGVDLGVVVGDLSRQSSRPRGLSRTRGPRDRTRRGRSGWR